MPGAAGLANSDSIATTDLFDELVCLPLAIAQAAAYLNRNRISIREYLRLLQNTELDLVVLISRAFRDETRYKGTANAVATTCVWCRLVRSAHATR